MAKKRVIILEQNELSVSSGECFLDAHIKFYD